MEKIVEKMYVILVEMYEDQQRQQGLSKVTGTSTRKRKMKMDDE